MERSAKDCVGLEAGGVEKGSNGEWVRVRFGREVDRHTKKKNKSGRMSVR